MQLQIYIKPQDESFIREMSERAKKYEFKGVKSLSELIILALKNYDPKISSFDLNDNQSLDELIDKKLEEKIKDFKLLLDNQKASNEIKPIEKTEKIKPSLKEKENIEEENLDLDSLSKKDLVSLISDFNYTGTQRELFKKAKAKYTEKASLVNQNKAELIKVVKFLQSQ